MNKKSAETVGVKWQWREAVMAAWAAYRLHRDHVQLSENLSQYKIERCSEILSCGKKISLLKQVNRQSIATDVVFVHGSPATGLRWQQYLSERVYTEFRLWSVDRPGFGCSDDPDLNDDIEQQADHIVEALRSQCEGAFIVVGHSLGGAVASAMALRHPDVVKGLILVAASLDPDLEQLKKIQFLIERSPWRAVLPRPWWNSNHELLRLPAALLRLSEEWSKVTVPVSIIHSEDDGLVPVENVEFIQKQFSLAQNISTDIAQAHGHFLPWKEPGRIFKAIETMNQRLLKDNK